MSVLKMRVEGSYTHELIIPESWRFSPLNEVIEIVGGNQPPKTFFSSVPGEGFIRLIQIRDYKSDKNIVFIPKEKARRFVTKDDVMIGRYGPPIFQILRGLEGAYNVALMKAVPILGGIDNDFLFHYLNNRNIFNYVESASDRTAGQSGVNKAHLEKYPVGFPPLAEQKEIASQLDSLLAKVDSIKNRLDAIPDIIKRFRQSVLAIAVTGKLTEEWRKRMKIHDISDVPNKILCRRREKWEEDKLNNFVKEKKKLTNDKWKNQYKEPRPIVGKMPITIPNEWESIIFSSVISKIKRGPSLKCNQEGKGIRYITSGNLEAGKVRLDYDNKYLDNFEKVDSCLLRPGDLILNCVNSLEQIGKSAVFSEEDGEALIGFNNYALELVEEYYDPSFAKIYTMSDSFKSQLYFLVKKAINQVSFASKELDQIAVPLPSLEEQTEVVRRVEQFFSYADKIEQKLKVAQQCVDKLTQSILAKAFRGELTAGWRDLNQALITGENSAEALLAKIKAERDALSKKKSPKKKSVKKQTTARKAQD